MIALLLLAAQLSPELTQHVNAGLKAKNAGDLRTAIAEFEQVVQMAPTLPAAHVNLGAVYYQSKDYARAIPALRKALELNAHLPGAHGMLGASLLAQGYAVEAIPHLEKGEVTDLLGVALIEAGREREALDRLEAALAQRPNDPDLLYYVSRAHAQLARRVEERLGTEFPEAARTRQLQAEALAAAGQREAAADRYRQALAARPDLRGVHGALGELAQTAGELEAAEKEYEAETKLAPGSPEAAYRLGYIRLERGEAKAALVELERAEQLKPGMPETLLQLGRARVALGQWEAAEKALLGVLKQEKTSALAESAHFQLAAIYRKLGRTADAERETSAFRQIREQRRK